MRLIDADILKDELARNITIWNFNVSYDGILAEIIDNVPTVKIPVARWDCYCEGQKVGYEKALSERPQGEWINDFVIKVNIPEEAKEKLIEELQKEPPKLVVDYNPEVDNFALGYAEGFKEGNKHRPQGEWIEHKGYYDSHSHRMMFSCECSACHMYEDFPQDDETGNVLTSHYCEHCGSNMWKGGNV